MSETPRRTDERTAGRQRATADGRTDGDGRRKTDGREATHGGRTTEWCRQNINKVFYQCQGQGESLVAVSHAPRTARA